jgi:hypothetical protein
VKKPPKSTRRYAIVIEGEPDNYSAYVPDLPGCVTIGATVDEVLREMLENDEKPVSKGSRRLSANSGIMGFRIMERPIR